MTPWNKSDRTTRCLHCGREFNIAPSRLKQSEVEKYGRGKFCSRKCKDLSRVGKPAWNSGKRGGEYISHYKNGFKGVFGSSLWSWTGTRQEYQTLHHWVRKTLGSPGRCEICGEEKQGREIHWANKSGKYKRDNDDWIRICRKCHFIYDQVEKRRVYA